MLADERGGGGHVAAAGVVVAVDRAGVGDAVSEGLGRVGKADELVRLGGDLATALQVPLCDRRSGRPALVEVQSADDHGAVVYAGCNRGPDPGGKASGTGVSDRVSYRNAWFAIVGTWPKYPTASPASFTSYGIVIDIAIPYHIPPDAPSPVAARSRSGMRLPRLRCPSHRSTP
jgi:hypothetical protein